MQGDLRKTVYKMIRIVYNTHVTMKSGLKALNKYHIFNLFSGYTPYRDEKRTERTIDGQVSFLNLSYTPYRDEKRTERYRQRIKQCRWNVTLPTAMKSGLKVPMFSVNIRLQQVTLPTAMKSGLKACAASPSCKPIQMLHSLPR